MTPLNKMSLLKEKTYAWKSTSYHVSMHIPQYLWGETILTASYLINRIPTRILKFETPLNCFKSKFPTTRLYSDLPLKVFGCTCFVYIPIVSWSKLDPRTEKCVFIWYASNQKGYKCFNPITKRPMSAWMSLFWKINPF